MSKSTDSNEQIQRAPAVLPHWLTEPCPPWCSVRPHDENEHYGDRVHYSDSFEMDISISDKPKPPMTPDVLDVHYEQHYRETEPRFRITMNGETVWATLTLGETECLRDWLTDAVDSVREAMLS